MDWTVKLWSARLKIQFTLTLKIQFQIYTDTQSIKIQIRERRELYSFEASGDYVMDVAWSPVSRENQFGGNSTC